MRKLTTEEFIEKAKIVHGDTYDYSKSIYMNSDNKIKIICKIHGEFEQKVANHLQGKGCVLCGIDKSAKAKLKTNAEFIEKVTRVHNNKYSYEHTNYTTTEKKITITCPIHGKFDMRATSHMQGHGCKMCRDVTVTTKLRTKEEDILVRFIEVHKNRYDYSKVKHIDMTTKVTIICKEHGEFKQIPVAHISGQGCPCCAKTGFDPNKTAILYYLKIITETNQILYKIGITNRTVNERFRVNDLQKIEVIQQEKFKLGQDAANKEQELLKMYKKYKYKGPKILDSGNTELFTEDVMALYYAKKI